MRKTMKKFLCVIIAVIMLVPVGMIISSAATCNCSNIPYVYIQGKQSIFVTREDGTKYAPMDEDSYDVAALSKKLLPMLFNALKTDDWTEYGTALYQMIADNYQDVMVAPDGSVKENSGPDFSWNESTVYSRHTSNMAYANWYLPDWRLSPMEVADDINNFVETVKRKTGHDKVNLVCRCMGGSYTLAYLQKYGYGSVDKLFIFSSVHNGTDDTEALLTGKMDVDSDGFIRYMNLQKNNMTNERDSQLMSYLVLTINALRETYTDEMVIAIVKKAYDKIKDITIAPLFREYYGVGGVMGSANEFFEDAVEYLYPTDELKAEYASQIKNARDFHYNVQVKVNDILREMDESGIPIYTFAEYGFQQQPLNGKKTNHVGEKVVGADKQSNGATVSLVNSTLSKEYIDSRIEAGYEKYISPDKQIDASTCLFPERTWFIKNANHVFPNPLHVMLNYLAFLDSPITIDSNPNYPQFMLLTKDEAGKEIFVKLTEENADNIDWTSMEKTTGETQKALNLLINFFKKLLNDFLGKIFDFVNAIKAKVHQ